MKVPSGRVAARMLPNNVLHLAHLQGWPTRPGRGRMQRGGPGGSAWFTRCASEHESLYGLGEQRAHRGHARVNVFVVALSEVAALSASPTERGGSVRRRGPTRPFYRTSERAAVAPCTGRVTARPVARRSCPARVPRCRAAWRLGGGRPCHTRVEGARGRWSAGVRRRRGAVPATV